MSALGQKQTYALQQAMSALLPIATAKADLRKKACLLYPKSGRVRCTGRCPVRANSRHARVKKRPPTRRSLKGARKLEVKAYARTSSCSPRREYDARSIGSSFPGRLLCPR